MKNQLFRIEAIEAKREQLLGDVILVRPCSFTLLTLGAVAIAAALIVFVVWGDYTRKSHVVGFLAPDKGLIKVYTPQAGIIVEKRVSQGQHVSKGDSLFVISMERGSRTTPRAQAAAIDKLQERRDSLQQALVQQHHIDELQVRSLTERIGGIGDELAQLDSEMATQQRRVAIAENIAKRYQKLWTKKFASDLDVTQRQEAWLEQQGRLQAMERNRASLEREMKELRFELHSMELKAKNARAAMKRDIAALEQELTEYELRRNLVISAPSNGVVTTILLETGQLATPNTPLLSIVPDDVVLEAHLLVPSRAIGFIAEGQTVSVRYQTFPYQRFGSYGGRVMEISKTMIMPHEADLPVTLEEPAYRVTVALERQTVVAYNQKIPLQSGMLLDADVLLDRRRLYQWILDPLYSVTGKV